VIVTGRDRQDALERSRRALREFSVEGIATALTFHRVVVEDPAFAPAAADAPFTVHTRWIETEFDNTIPAYTDTAEGDATGERTSLVVEVDGKRLQVSLPAGFATAAPNGATGAGTAKRAKRSRTGGSSAASGNAVAAPMQGTVIKIAVAEGEQVAEGDLIVVLEAMKMEQPLTAHRAGTVTGLAAEVGATVPAGTVLCEISD
jgi:acetyl-CoA/propionyl-CoA carboxylase, biotin carboxylase, biotin carboxyl carrier protein